MAQISESAMLMARRLKARVRDEAGGGWVLLGKEVQEALVISAAALTILGWRSDVGLFDAQELLRAVHSLFQAD